MLLSKKKNNMPIVPVAISLVVLSLFYLSGFSSSSKLKKGMKNGALSDLEVPTQVLYRSTDSEIIKSKRNPVYVDSVVSIFFNTELGQPFLLYVYKDVLSEEQKNDRFFLHVYLKDFERIKDTPQKSFLNLDFSSEPTALNIDGERYFVFRKYLKHEFLDPKNIKYIKTGRFNREKGRSLSVDSINIDGIVNRQRPSSLEKLTISISNKDFQNIVRKRDEALANGILVTTDDDLYKAKVSLDGSKAVNSNIRLKGDWVDHLDHSTKWSFRIITDGLSTIKGMRKFSIQHPKVRNYLWEWLFNKAVKDNDLIGLRYDFVDATIKIVQDDGTFKNVSLGIMAVEEAFDKILIENNRRREGLIIGFDESVLWEDRQQQYSLGLPDSTRSKNHQAIRNAPINVYNANKVLADPKLAKQFHIAKDLVAALRAGEAKISEVFDIDKLTTFVALSNLFGGKHGFLTHNLRIYYNPITNKLEPISFDSNSGDALSTIINYPFSKGDKRYTEKLTEKLETVSSSDFVNDLVDSHSEDLEELSSILYGEFGPQMDLSLLEYNSNVIKKLINPSKAIIANLANFDESQMTVQIKNLSAFPIVIEGIVHKKGKKLTKKIYDPLVYPNQEVTIAFPLKASFVNAFVSKKNKKGVFRFPNDVKKINISHRVLGLKHLKKSEIIPYGNTDGLAETISSYQKTFQSNINKFDFVHLDTVNSEITVKTGEHIVTENIVIPSDFSVSIEPGCRLDFKANATLVSYSALRCEGTKEAPIEFYSSDGTGAGIFVTNTSEKSFLSYCYFDNLSNPTSSIWELSGAVNFHEAEVEIDNSIFKNNRSEDGLNIIRSTFLVRNSQFTNTQSDAFDGDFVNGKFYNCQFINTGNDGVDVSGSTIYLEDITIENPSDKAISAGEASTITGKDIEVIGGEIGIVSKDLSNVSLSEVSIKNTKLGFSAFQKKSEFGNAEITIANLELINNALDHLIENNCKLTIDGMAVKTVSEGVINQMYGNEYGKSSK